MLTGGRLRTVLQKYAGLPAADIVSTIQDEVTGFCGGALQFEDMTITVLKIL